MFYSAKIGGKNKNWRLLDSKQLNLGNNKLEKINSQELSKVRIDCYFLEFKKRELTQS